MMIKAFSYSENGKEKLSEHFFVRDFASASYVRLFSDLILIDLRLADLLEKVYKHFNCKRIKIVSGYRTAEHEKLMGKKGESLHTFGRAVDFEAIAKNGNYISPKLISNFLENEGVYGVKICGERLVHMDTRISAMKSMDL